MTRFIGYKNRRPYLWCVDLEQRTVKAASELDWIPQAIDDIVPLGDAVALRFGLRWGVLAPDLSGPLWKLNPERSRVVEAQSNEVYIGHDGDQSVGRLIWHDEDILQVSHPTIKYWHNGRTASPDGKSIALTGSTAPRKQFDLTDLSPQPYVSESATVLVTIDIESGQLKIFDGCFDGSGFPAWSADGAQITVGASYEPRRLFVADKADTSLRTIEFKVHAPLPLIDAALIDLA